MTPETLTKDQKKVLVRTLIAALEPKKLTDQRAYELGVHGSLLYDALEEYETINRFELAWILAGVIYEILYTREEEVN